MSNIQLAIIDPEYKRWICDIEKRFRQQQIKAAVQVNSSKIEFYWSLGRDIVRYSDNKYDSQFYSVLSSDLCRELLDVSGLLKRNIRYMKDFLRICFVIVKY